MMPPAPPPRPAGNANAGREDTAFSDLVPNPEPNSDTQAAPTTLATPGRSRDSAPDPGRDADPAAADDLSAQPAVSSAEQAVTDALAALFAAAGVIPPDAPADEISTDAPTDAAADAQPVAQGDASAIPDVAIAVVVPTAPAVPDIVAPQAEAETPVATAATDAPAIQTPPVAAAPADRLAQASETASAEAAEGARQPQDIKPPAAATTEAKADLESDLKSDLRADLKADIKSDARISTRIEAKTDASLDLKTRQVAEANEAAGGSKPADKADARPHPEAAAKPEEPRVKEPATPATPASAAQPAALSATPPATPDPSSVIQFTPAVTHAPPHLAAHAAQGAPAIVAIPIAAVPMEIAAQAREGKSRFEIRLDPPELGRIDVRLDIDRHGQVTSRLTVERVETLDLLRREAPQLDRALQDAGLKTGDSALQFSLRDQDTSGRDPRQQAREHFALADETIQLPETAARLYGRSGAAGGVDIRV